MTSTCFQVDDIRQNDELEDCDDNDSKDNLSGWYTGDECLPKNMINLANLSTIYGNYRDDKANINQQL